MGNVSIVGPDCQLGSWCFVCMAQQKTNWLEKPGIIDKIKEIQQREGTKLVRITMQTSSDLPLNQAQTFGPSVLNGQFGDVCWDHVLNMPSAATMVPGKKLQLGDGSMKIKRVD